MDNAFRALVTSTVDFFAALHSMPPGRTVGPRTIRQHLAARYDFSAPRPLARVTSELFSLLQQWSIHGSHPRYFGPSSQGVDASGVVAAALTALFDPQLAVWEAAPFAVEAEQHLLGVLAGHLGMPGDTLGMFTSGASEATLSALIVALTHTLPTYAHEGLAGTPHHPRIYVSEQGHPSIVKLAHAAGLGRNAVCSVPCREDFTMDLPALAAHIATDRAHGSLPLMVVATAGSTETGSMDPLDDTATLCAREGVWMHVDAAWGGCLALVPSLVHHLQGVARADSVAWDAHKGLGVPIGAGMFFCRHPEAVRASFDTSAPYMPRTHGARTQPFALGLAWSRRFTGLPLFMALAERGLVGVGERVLRQSTLANHLRTGLVAAGWEILNRTPLPLVCFTHETLRARRVRPSELARRLRQREIAWLGEGSLAGIPHLRAHIGSHLTETQDLDAVVAELTVTLDAVCSTATGL